jgi:hypothetical protein
METSLTKPIPRLIRFVPALIAGGQRTLAVLDTQKNLLHVDRGLYDALTPYQQDRVIKTSTSLEMVEQE